MRRAHPTIRRVLFAALLVAVGATLTMLLILVLQLPEQFQGLRPGDLLPSIRLVSPAGELVDTHSWRGRPTLLMLFDPSCPACQQELYNIDALAPAMPNLRIALLCTRSRDARESRVAIYRDPTGILTRRMRRFAVPALYWIGPDGRIEYARSGARSLSEDAAIFDTLLAGNGAPALEATADPAGRTGTLCR